ncbi:autotransporter outer membrane beta-barrel domain-containing protein, partial [Campylobacter jejuni]|nr:autotransporter outer membrane beta-barrel domain-containing protein [Campylobacter jejuni]
MNQGTIQGKIGIEEWSNGSSTITVRTFENKKTIDGHIYMGGYGTINIENFTNEGTITMTNTNGNDGVIYFENHQNNGNKGNIHIKTFKNTGTIQSNNNKNSISLKAHNSTTPTLENFINEGFIKGKIGIENKNGFTGTITVGTFDNKSGGFIDGDIYMGLWGG